MLLAVGIAISLATLALGLSAVPLVLILAVTTLVIAAIAKSKIGGQTGDILGATQQVSEIIILTSLAA
jgi:adenosylcobinamide-GDP ribazoletransferase